LRSVPRQPNPQRKEQHLENSLSSPLSSFSPYCSLIKSTKPVSEMLARREATRETHPCLFLRTQRLSPARITVQTFETVPQHHCHAAFRNFRPSICSNF